MLEQFFHLLGYGLCHQLPERSLFAGGWQLPVCARDTGIYVGFALSLAAIAVLERRRRATDLPPAWALVLGAVGVSAMVLDGVTSYAGLRGTTNLLRLATGLAAGWALPLVVVPMLNGQMWSSASRGRLLDGPRALIWLAAGIVAYPFLLFAMPALGVVYPLAVSAAIIVTLVAVNLVFVTLLPRFERAAAGISQAVPQIALALALAVAEIALAGALRAVLEGGVLRVL
ncbi:DUF2085 domain-containing protein [Coriobacteriia bacterium Es71-Z0120]|uniref:DUF2085 domain-containing protein n=1 Tax=Parvivirga hydrogeniphila TaxID=2939460 RepID=UPI002260DA62|nr:DUF2085 domain-containing protein [Parvivirga hydrogeniphila]MCL4078493.1 DUF2085 domain-containing protein [Parvivirga hydrogeniphila]